LLSKQNIIVATMLLALSAKHSCALSQITSGNNDKMCEKSKTTVKLPAFPSELIPIPLFFMSKNSFRKIQLILATEKFTIMKNHG